MKSGLFAVPLLGLGSLSAVRGADVSVPSPQPIPHEVIAAITHVGRTSLPEGPALRVSDRASLVALLESGSDYILVNKVIAAVDDRFPDGIPADQVLVVGMAHRGCLAPTSVGLAATADGEVVLTAVGDPREGTVDCEARVPTVAVIAADIDDVPAGSTDRAELVAFTPLGAFDPRPITGIELHGVDDLATLSEVAPADAIADVDLPDLAPTDRRLAFVRAACDATTAELAIAGVIDARLQGSATGATECVPHVMPYLAVFDIPAGHLPPGPVVLVGGTPLPVPSAT